MNGLSSEKETLIAVQDNGGTSLKFSSHISNQYTEYYILKKLHSNTL